MSHHNRDGDSTPIEGVPIQQMRPRVDTGPTSSRFLGSVHGTGVADAVGPPSITESAALSPEEFIDSLADRLIEKSQHGSGDGGGGGPKGKRFLGLEAGSWTKLVAGWTAAVVLAGFAWYSTVSKGLAERPTKEELKTQFVDVIDRHSAKPHVQTDARLKVLETQQREIHDSQIRQEQVNKSQTSTLEEIRDDVKQLRRRRR